MRAVRALDRGAEVTALPRRIHCRADPYQGARERLAEHRPAIELALIDETTRSDDRRGWAVALARAGLASRAERVAQCGTLHAAVVVRGMADVQRSGFASAWCRDRLCPRCAASRAREMGHDLRAFLAHDLGEDLHRDGQRLWFATLTQRKDPNESVSEALVRLMASLRALTWTRSAGGRELRRRVPAMIRAIECTWSSGAERRSDGTRRTRGFHVHVHLLLRASDRAADWWPYMLGRWLECSPEANVGAQKLIAADARRIGQLAKYPFATADVDARRHREVTRQLATGLHGARMVAGLGDWYGWRKASRLLQDPPQRRLYCRGTPIRTVLRLADPSDDHCDGETHARVVWRRRDDTGIVREHEVEIAARLVLAGGYLRSHTEAEDDREAGGLTATGAAYIASLRVSPLARARGPTPAAADPPAPLRSSA